MIVQANYLLALIKEALASFRKPKPAPVLVTEPAVVPTVSTPQPKLTRGVVFVFSHPDYDMPLVCTPAKLAQYFDVDLSNVCKLVSGKRKSVQKIKLVGEFSHYDEEGNPVIL